MKAASTRGGLNGSGELSVKNSYNIGVIANTSQEKPAGILGFTQHSKGLTDEKTYCVDNVEIILNFLYNFNGQTHDTTICIQEYMKSQEFMNELNTYVNNYNEEHKNDEDFVSLRSWKYNAGSYPTFE